LIEETATVVAIGNDGTWVETQRKSACGQCAAKKGCGTSVLENIFGNKRNRLKVINNIPVSVGDQVVIGLEEQALVRGSLAVYATPIIAMLVLGYLGDWLSLHYAVGNREIMSIIFALAGLFLGFRMLRQFSDSIRNDKRYQPVVIRQVHPQSDDGLKVI
jgi:sigma-E factor negative regulatory protein RseC